MSMIHKFSMNGYNIVLDVNGGAVHVLDDVAYDLLDFYKEKSKEEILEILKSKYQ
ncbi:thioether cross-link-forming SCIFF peptide maturase, partial [Clostridioides difficile]|nr:thioether cross-link-forming SCIFF peptide maturase [Clostridioides difficile]MCE0620007.1 thioether cross-link-forming SCIFF peptide maturase [Clostridioides difficile]MCE0669946.1 thioether cross-link-forming SCIFF peptide maturase [Clostridioides difficile]